MDPDARSNGFATRSLAAACLCPISDRRGALAAWSLGSHLSLLTWECFDLTDMVLHQVVRGRANFACPRSIASGPAMPKLGATGKACADILRASLAMAVSLNVRSCSMLPSMWWVLPCTPTYVWVWRALRSRAVLDHNIDSCVVVTGAHRFTLL